MREPVTEKNKPETRAGSAHVVVYGEDTHGLSHEGFLKEWGDGFFDFERPLNVLNSKSGRFKGRFDEGFYVLSRREI